LRSARSRVRRTLPRFFVVARFNTQKRSGRATLVCTGALTNAALLLSVYPELAEALCVGSAEPEGAGLRVAARLGDMGAEGVFVGVALPEGVTEGVADTKIAGQVMERTRVASSTNTTPVASLSTSARGAVKEAA
jgi:hypothetical protein